MLIQPPASPAQWAAYYALRYAVLRQPWGQLPGSERADDDDAPTTIHALIIGLADQALAVGRLHPSGPGQGQVRFMAVVPEAQGQGLGGQVLRYLEQQAQAFGMATIELHARKAAVPFYLRQGYVVVAPSHTLFGQIPHFLMRKQLPALPAPAASEAHPLTFKTRSGS
jgi:predicted GNAT family N-acyltransferase